MCYLIATKLKYPKILYRAVRLTIPGLHQYTRMRLLEDCVGLAPLPSLIEATIAQDAARRELSSQRMNLVARDNRRRLDPDTSSDAPPPYWGRATEVVFHRKTYIRKKLPQARQEAQLRLQITKCFGEVDMYTHASICEDAFV